MTTPMISTLVDDYRHLKSWSAVAKKYGVTRQAVHSRVSTALPSEEYAELVADVETDRAEDRGSVVIDAKEFERDIQRYGTMRASWDARGMTRYAYEQALHLGGVLPAKRQEIIERAAKQRIRVEYRNLCRRENKGAHLTTTWLRANGYRKLVGEIDRHFGGFARFLAIVQGEAA